MKSLMVLNFLMGTILVLGVGVTANTITMGCKIPYERLLASRSMFIPGTRYGIYKADFSYPAKAYSRPGILSRIVIKDWGSPENFGYFSLLKGGPGENYATISVRSQSSKLFNCTIEFYGH